MAAGTPESGTGTTMSASAGCSRASRRPSISRLSIDGAAEDQAVGPREIDVLEDAVLVRLLGGEMQRFDAGSGDAHHFAGLDFADVFGAEQIERAGFRGDDPGVAEPAEAERAEAARIAHGVEFVARQNQQRIGAFDLIERVAERALQIARASCARPDER